MRLLGEIAVVILLIALAWEKPFKRWFVAPPPPPPVTYSAPEPNSPPKGAWMWDPNRRTPLDRGSYNQHHGVSAAPFVTGDTPIYTDSYGRKYWVDGKGQQHYVAQ